VLNEQVRVSRRRIDEKKVVSVPVKHEEVSIRSQGDAPTNKEAA
jgi:stress response protein YsnF